MAKIRVLQNIETIAPGGVETFIMNYYRNIDKDKVQFDFIVRADESTDFYADEIKKMGGKIYHLPFYNKNAKETFIKGLRRILRENPDYKIIHSHSNILSSLYLMAAKKEGVPVRIAHSHNTRSKKDILLPVKKLIKPLVNKYATARFACGDKAARWLFGDAVRDSVKVIPNAIDCEKFKYSEEKRSKVRAELSIKDQTVYINIARFSEQKNHMFLLDIFAEILKKDSNSLLVLVGNGELFESAKEKAAKLGISENVMFLGVRQDADRLLSAADVFLLPSLYEGLPFTLIEAQASGLACVTSDTVPVDAKILDEYYTIGLKEPADIWAEKILEIKNYVRKDTNDIMRQKGYEITEAAKKLEEIYTELCKN